MGSYDYAFSGFDWDEAKLNANGWTSQIVLNCALQPSDLWLKIESDDGVVAHYRGGRLLSNPLDIYNVTWVNLPLYEGSASGDVFELTGNITLHHTSDPIYAGITVEFDDEVVTYKAFIANASTTSEVTVAGHGSGWYRLVKGATWTLQRFDNDLFDWVTLVSGFPVTSTLFTGFDWGVLLNPTVLGTNIHLFSSLQSYQVTYVSAETGGTVTYYTPTVAGSSGPTETRFF
jgi:hypothetical protein